MPGKSSGKRSLRIFEVLRQSRPERFSRKDLPQVIERCSGKAFQGFQCYFVQKDLVQKSSGKRSRQISKVFRESAPEKYQEELSGKVVWKRFRTCFPNKKYTLPKNYPEESSGKVLLENRPGKLYGNVFWKSSLKPFLETCSGVSRNNYPVTQFRKGFENVYRTKIIRFRKTI